MAGLWDRLSCAGRLRLVALSLVAGVWLVESLPVNLMISQGVLSWLAQDQEIYRAEFTGTHAYLDGLSAAVLPALVRRDPRELVEALDRAQGDRYAGIEPRFVILELRDGTILTSSDARRFPAESVVLPKELRNPAEDRINQPEPSTDHVWLVRTLHTDDGFRAGRLFAQVDIPGLERDRHNETSRLRLSWVIGWLMTPLFPLGIYFVLKRTLPAGMANWSFLAISIIVALLLVPPFYLFQSSPSSRGSQFQSISAFRIASSEASGWLKQGDYPAAEEVLKRFVRRYPDDARAGEVQYWLGETYYARGNYAEAADAFAVGFGRDPGGTMAPEALLKLGMSHARAGQKQKACQAFKTPLAVLDDDFPATVLAQLDDDLLNARSVIKERAEDEKKKLGC
jgi:tol-pal system protein YbgF